MTTAAEIVEYAHQRGASDVVLTAGATPFVRIEGDWLPLRGVELSTASCEQIVRSVVPAERMEELKSRRDINFSREMLPFGRLRFNVHFQRDTLAATIRLIWPRVRTIEELGLSRELGTLALKQQGLMLVCGRTGSGKSTTLAAVVHHILQQRRAHVITIEDPIEYVHDNGIGVCEQREMQSDTPSWEGALRNVLRQAPDVIVIGELQDRHSIASAVSAAETGHFVLASVHAHDTVQCLTRIIDAFPGDQQQQIRVQVASSLTAVLAQQLVPRAVEGGRVLATELLVANPAIRNLVRSGDYAQIHNCLISGRNIGMHTMHDSLETLLSRKLISQDEVLQRLNDHRLVGVV